MSDILHRLARDPASGAEIFMSAPPHILAALIDDGLAASTSRTRRNWKAIQKARVQG